MTGHTSPDGRGHRARPAVLVTDGEQRAALALVRSLGRQGHDVYVCSARGRSLAGASRFARAEEIVPDPLSHPREFALALSRLSSRWDIRALIPVSEPSLLAALAASDLLSAVEIPFPDTDTFRAICDKARLLEVAEDVGIAVPRQRTLASRADVSGLELESLPYPLVLKPSRSVGEHGGSRTKQGVSYARDPDDLRRQLKACTDAAFPLLLQQRITGPGVGIFLLLWGDQTLASFAHRRLREKPPSGGVSVYRESIQADPGLVRQATELLQRFGWEGVAMVEFKVDAATGMAYLMEVNGRFWGSLQLAIDAGVDFPVMLLDAARGERVEPVDSYRVGVRSRWWWGDVDQLLSRLRRSAAALDLPPDAPSRWRSALEFMVLWRRGDRNEIFRWNDPAPLIRESIDWFARR